MSPIDVPLTALPLLPLRGGVVLPGVQSTLPVGRRRSIAVVDALSEGGASPPRVVIGVQRDARELDPSAADLHPIGTLVEVLGVQRAPGGARLITVRGLSRVDFARVHAGGAHLTVDVVPSAEPSADAAETRLAAEALAKVLAELDPKGEGAVGQVVAAFASDHDAGLLADRVAATLELTFEQAVRVLLTLDVGERLRTVTALAGDGLGRAEVQRTIERQVRQAFGSQQREAVLRQQLRAIQKELGEGGQPEDEHAALRERLDALELPAEARKIVDREAARLRTLAPGQAEYNVARTWLETVADLPWGKRAAVSSDLDAVQAHLEADHHGLDEVKKRVLEHLAVLQLATDQRGTILCLSGPPGTGKTSVARSIAEATGRPFVRVSLGGVRDEAAIRGHRRTYVGALPGRIIEGLRKAGASNPVMLLDEIDKMSVGYGSGSPEAALLEVLDAEQNVTFTDHYLELPFDLSEVLFVCTANVLSTLSPPLRDRLEVVQIDGYTPDEQLTIARRHLLPRQRTRHGLGEGTLALTDATLEAIIRDYTREAGVRQLERELVRLCRASALAVARDASRGPFVVEPDDLATHLGKPRFRQSALDAHRPAGVATGLAWTPVGGDVLLIETSRMPGTGQLTITGQLGDVMTESARAALSYVRSHAAELGVDPAFLERQDLHIHVPAGGVPKDGPSAGVTIFTALTSLLTGRPVRPDLAMTGECTLRGRVLPVGGIKAKVLAAHRAGLAHVVLPAENAPDLEDLPDVVREALTFTLAADMAQVLAVALCDIAPSEVHDAPGLERVAPSVQPASA